MTVVADCHPVSWLRLERHALGELPPAEREIIAGHLEICAACRSCFEQIQSANLQPMPALPIPVAVATSPAAKANWFSRKRAFAFAGALVAALVLLVLPMLRPPKDVDVVAERRIHTKGGDVTWDLVRERNGSIATEPTSFGAADRFKVLLTCPPPLRLFADLVILQDGQTGRGVQDVQDVDVSFPGPPSVISCGNRVPFPQAFRITGRSRATVCLIVDPSGPTPRDRLTPARLTDRDAQPGCLRLDPTGD
jgi:Putative zinc-finger